MNPRGNHTPSTGGGGETDVLYREKIIKRFVDLQLKSYRQIFSRSAEEVAQLDHLTRRYAFLKRLLKSTEELNVFPDAWGVQARMCRKFCEYTKQVDFFWGGCKR